MEWTDDAIILSSRRHGESAAILEVLTRGHGRHLGLVRGGGSRSKRPLLQPGNSVHLVWRARLSEHLGSFTAEAGRTRAGDLIESRSSLIGLNAFCAVAGTALPEREAHGALFEAAVIFLDALGGHEFAHWAPLYVRWEAGLLEALGFGLDLAACAAGGDAGDLAFVSPRSGRAVSAAAGAEYAARLLALPAFLLGSQNAAPNPAEIAAGLRLTGHFLVSRVLAPHGKQMPAVRTRLDALADSQL